MKIDLHIHSRNCSDGKLGLEDIFKEAKKRDIKMISITDHDSMDCQTQAAGLAERNEIKYITGMELNITFTDPVITKGKNISLDFLAYNYDPSNEELRAQLNVMKNHRINRAKEIMDKINVEFEKEGIKKLTGEDMSAIEESVDGVFGRPHIAHYLVDRGICTSKQDAFDRYLVKCDVPKYPFAIEDASRLVRNAGGILVFAHPNDPNGTSLIKLTRSIAEQTEIIEKAFLPYIDGIECWHSRHTTETIAQYLEFTKRNHLIATGGTDCHQNPIIMGTIDVPDEQVNEILRLLDGE
jgi:predicted metal-dependent phosphoesterase TrpH